MVVNLIKSKQMFSLTLPNKVNGQYWLTDLDEKQQPRQLIRIEAVDGVWVVNSNNKVGIQHAGASVPSFPLTDATYLNLKIVGSEERVVLFTEAVDRTRQMLTKIAVTEGAIFTIGRTEENNIQFDDMFVSSSHAKLIYDGDEWSISDTDSLNGTYVNSFRIRSRKLQPGDFIYIMGLKIVIGQNYLAINNPDMKLKIRSDSLKAYAGQNKIESDTTAEFPETQYFLRSPRFRREVSHEVISIDPPPPLQKMDTVPMALMLGPSITMGMTSVSTGILTVTNTISNGGKISQALPTLIMSVSMLLGTILWPILTKKYEKKQKIKAEKTRQAKYLAYLNDISDAVRKKAKEQSDILIENQVDQNECADRIVRRKSNLWERVIGQPDFLKLRFGTGNLPMDAEVKYQEKKFTLDDDSLQNAMLSLAEEPKQLKNVPISLSLTDNIALGLFGERAATDNMLKALILQMVALHSYDELKIMLVTDESDAERWKFVKYIPHFWNNEKTARFFGTSIDEIKELSAYMEHTVLTRAESDKGYVAYSPFYVIIFTSAKLTKRCDSVHGLLNYKNNAGFTMIVADEMFDAFPKETKTIVYVDGDKSEIFDKDDTTGHRQVFTADKANDSVFGYIAGKLANIELELDSRKNTLPSLITFLEMFRVGKVEHLNSLSRWKENNPTKTLQTPVGVDADGELFLLDLHEKFHGPHGLVAGMTGSGKSEFIITYILSMAVNYHPDEVAFILIDYKGGGLTGAFEDKDRGIKLPHLAGTITNLDGAAIKRSLTSIQSELRRRQAIFNEARKMSNEGTMDIYKYQQLYRDRVVSEPLPHLFIISDEFAELKKQQPEFMEQLISTARIGRSLGVHLILATQKPSGVVDDQIWSNSKFRVCLKVQDRSDSQDMIKCPDAAELSQTGRFYLQVGFNEFFALGQSAWCGAEYLPSDVAEKKTESSVQVIDNLGRVMMNVKPQKKTPKDKKIKQIVAIVKYLSDLAAEENIRVQSLWLDPIPATIYLEDVERKYGITEGGFTLNPVVGEYDDPFNQRQSVLTVPFSTEGNCLIYGSTGNGKTMLLTTLCYSLIKHHTPEELSLYILDYGSETLKSFEAAPQVGGVVLSADEEKTINLFKLLKQEMDNRKALFALFGGDFETYARNADKPVPNIVVMINNFSAFAEQYEDLLEDFTILTRDGVKYGIFFIATASTTNAVRYKIQQNFKMMLTMQLNDATDYSMIVGKTDGLTPEKHKGRGLVALEKPYEFQTANAMKSVDIGESIRSYCRELAVKTQTYAKPIPVLPNAVDMAFVEKHITTLKAVPVGVAKNTLDISTVNLTNKVVLPVLSQDIEECTIFASAFSGVLSRICDTKLIDVSGFTPDAEEIDAEATVVTIFDEMVNRNNTYKRANRDETVLEQFPERVYLIFGFRKFFDRLSADGKDKMKTLLEKADPLYKLHFVICDGLTDVTSYNYEAWYKLQAASGEGIWVGDGVANQFQLKISKTTSDLYDEVGPRYGYTIVKGRPILTKLLSEEKENV